MILKKILDKKREQIEEQKKHESLEELKARVETIEVIPKNFYDVLKKKDRISIIAEIKKASPSKGVIKEDFNHMEIAKRYYEADVDAVSVLTEKNFFLGDDQYIKDIKEQYPLTVLRKDFIIDIWQIYQSKLLGADAILLIAGALTYLELTEFQKLAQQIGLQCLVEVHNIEQLKMVLNTDTKIIGINNRDLKTFNVDLTNTEKLIPYIPKDKVIVSESGIKGKSDVEYLRNIGVDAVLIGETFMRTDENELNSIINVMRT